jgi:hypothetical protein
MHKAIILFLIQRMSTYIPLEPHMPPPHLVKEVEEYLGQLDEKHKRLHEIAVKTLASSYFVERSHGFLNWKKKQIK